MNYATWKIDFTDPMYGTGPEEKIAELGFLAGGLWVNGSINLGGTILGYVSGPQDESQLTKWSFKNLSQDEALDFVKKIHPTAILSVDGEITVPNQGI
jgi:hypothetical protein